MEVNFATYFDSTNLKADATIDDISSLCIDALTYRMAAVCINPYRVSQASSILKGSGIKVCTVIGFPLGADILAGRLTSAQQALELGADELDVVVNLGALKDGEYEKIEYETEEFIKLKQIKPYTLKVIVETALLTEEELITMTKMLSELSVDYIKTSTGMAARGVSMEDIRIINKYKSPELKIKAAGGIRDLDFALELIEAGVDRLGSSSAVALWKEYYKNLL